MSCVLLALLASTAGLRAQTWQLAPGETRVWDVDAEASRAAGGALHRAFELRVGEAGRLTLEARSTEVDPLILLHDDAGEVRLLDDDGGLGWNARLVIDAEPGTPLVGEVVSQSPFGGGRLEFQVSAGEVPLPEGRALHAALADFHTARGDTFRAVGLEQAFAEEYHLAGQHAGRLGDERRRRALYEAVLPVARALGHELLEAVAAAHIASAAVQLGDPEEARAQLDAAAALAERLGHPQLALLVLESRVALLDLTGEADAAVQAYVSFEEGLRAAGMAGTAARKTLERARLLAEHSRFDAAEAALDEARRAFATLADPGAEPELLLTEAVLAQRRGRFAEAARHARRAAELAQDPVLLAQAVARLGDAEFVRGRGAVAGDAYHELHRLGVALDDPRLRVHALHGLALVARDVHEIDHALELLREAADLARDFGDASGELEVRITLGAMLAEAGRVEPAREQLALLDARLLGAPLAQLVPRVEEVRSLLAEARGDASAAEQGLRRQLALEEQLGDTYIAANVRVRLARLRAAAGDHAGAREHGEAALAVLRGTQNHGALAEVLLTLAGVELARGETARAARHYADAERAHLDEQLARAPEQWAERLRATQRSRELAALGQDLAARELAAAPRDEPAQPSAAFARGLARADLWRARGLLAGLSPESVERAPTPSEAQALLDALTERVAADAGAFVQFAEGRERLYAYVVDAHGARHRDLGPLAELRAAVEDYLALISDPARLGTAGDLARAGLPLHRRLIEPLELGDAGGLLRVVDAAVLAGLPLEALPVAAPEGVARVADLRFLLDERRVSYAPSAALLVASRAPPAAGELLVLADPRYPAPDAAGTLRAARAFERLPGTRDEALAIARTWLDRHLPDADGEALLAPLQDGAAARLDEAGLRLRLGAEATRAALLEHASGAGILHLATHGLEDPEEPRRSLLALSPGDDDAGELPLAEILELELQARLVVLSACETARGSFRHGEGMRSLAWSFLRAGAREVVATLWQVDDRETSALMGVFYADYLAGSGGDASRALQAARLALRSGALASGAAPGSGRGKRVGARPAPSPGRDLAGHPFFWASFVHLGGDGPSSAAR